MVKLLLCGQVNGQWGVVFERAQKLNAAAKGVPFQLLLCVGGAFPFPLEYLDGSKRVPIPTYFIASGEDTGADGDVAWRQDPQQQALYDKLAGIVDADAPLQVAENLFFLGKQGVATIEGLKVAFVSGTAASGTAADAPQPFLYSPDSVKTLVATLEKQGEGGDIDFLLTTDYAANFQRLLPDQQVPAELQSEMGSPVLQELLQAVHPKYHITSCASAAKGGVFYQRLPYVSENRLSGRKCVTRLIGLCGVSASKNKAHKYLHALQVTPTADAKTQEQVDIPAGTTQNPYVPAPRSPERFSRDESFLKRQRVDGPPGTSGGGGLSAEQIAQLTAKSANGAQYFYDQKIAARGQRQGALRQDQQRSNDNRKRAPPVPERTECWFCLATPSVERHLIVSIGQEAYLAMPKGAINADHLLIVPIAHEASSMKLSSATWTEVERFKSALRTFFASQDKDMVVFDRNIQTMGATHCHLQVVGIPRAKAAAAKRVFQTEGEKYNVKFQELTSDESLQSKTDGKPFFYAEVPSDAAPGVDPTVVRLLNFVEGKHYMQFGRHAAACLLDMPRRANWKYCVVPKPEEEQLTQSFKKQWKQFDFTLDDEDDE